jgi:putative colanic acid biosynthesis acetyltransferase WcaF
MTKVRNDLFSGKLGLKRGRSRMFEAMWYLSKCILFLTPLPFPSSIKRCVLRWFGASVGCGVVIKPRVNIHFPWKLSLGDYTWVGEEVFILNFEQVTIGEHCCISQRVFLCGGNHDYRLPDMRYRNRPITIEDGVWVGAQSFVGPDVTIGREAVIIAGSVVTHNQPVQMVCTGNPCAPTKSRWNEANAVTAKLPTAPEPKSEISPASDEKLQAQILVLKPISIPVNGLNAFELEQILK